MEKIPSRRANKKIATELESTAIKTKKRANRNITIKPISILSIAPIQKISEAVISIMLIPSNQSLYQCTRVQFFPLIKTSIARLDWYFCQTTSS